VAIKSFLDEWATVPLLGTTAGRYVGKIRIVKKALEIWGLLLYNHVAIYVIGIRDIE
jgi:hypothetical protein